MVRPASHTHSARNTSNSNPALVTILNTNYTTAYDITYQYSAGNAAMGGTWNNPTAIYTPRFVRWNVTVDF